MCYYVCSGNISADRTSGEKEMNYVLKDDVLYIREMTVEDTDMVIGWRNMDFVMANFLYRTKLTREDHLNWIRTKVETGKVRQFIIGLNENFREFGSVYFRDIDNEQKSCEFGIFLGDKEMLGKGYGFRAQKLAMDIALNEMGMEYISLRVLEKNLAAIRTYEKCGFTHIEDKSDFLPTGEKVIFMEYVTGEKK